jgi:MraZ protein
MFQVRGQFDIRMDGKGRLPLPVRLRSALEASSDDRLILTCHDGGLMGFVESRWAKMERRFAGASIFDHKVRDFLLAFVASACEVEPDAQGRILVPRSLRARAALDRRCVLVSYLGLIEIWDADRWAARQGAAVARIEAEGGLTDFVVFDPDDGGEDL